MPQALGANSVNVPAKFALRLHFVLKERIGIGEISAKKLLTISFSASPGSFRTGDHIEPAE
jgi:hypothetical protein